MCTLILYCFRSLLKDGITPYLPSSCWHTHLAVLCKKYGFPILFMHAISETPCRYSLCQIQGEFHADLLHKTPNISPTKMIVRNIQTLYHSYVFGLSGTPYEGRQKSYRLSAFRATAQPQATKGLQKLHYITSILGKHHLILGGGGYRIFAKI